MTITVTNNSISSDSGRININDSMFIWPDKIIETDTFYFSDKYVFEKNKKIPVGYFAIKSTSDSSVGQCVFDFSTNSVGSMTNIDVEYFLPPYNAQLLALLSSKAIESYTWNHSSCISRITLTNSITATEKQNFLAGEPVDYKLYSVSNKCPAIVYNPQAVTGQLTPDTNPVSIKLQSANQVYIQSNQSTNWCYVMIFVDIKND